MEIIDKKQSLRDKINKKIYSFGDLKISFVHLFFLIVVNVSLICVLTNFFVRGYGAWEWWSIVVTVVLIFSYLILRIFTSSGIMLGRQVTFLITLFNLFLNLMKIFGMVKSNQHWELTVLIPLVNLLCLVFLVVVFAIRRKKFRTIIMPSLKISLVSIIPIVRLYFLMGHNYMLPIFNYIVLVLAFALFVNSLFLNWLNILKVAEDNIEMIKKGTTEFKKASQKVATVNRKIDSINTKYSKVKSFFRASGSAFKEFFTSSKKKEKRQTKNEEIAYQAPKGDNRNKKLGLVGRAVQSTKGKIDYIKNMRKEKRELENGDFDTSDENVGEKR